MLYILVATFCTAKQLELFVFMWGGLATHYLIQDLCIKRSRNPKSEAIYARYIQIPCFHMINVPFMGTSSPSWAHLPLPGHIFSFHGHIFPFIGTSSLSWALPTANCFILLNLSRNMTNHKGVQLIIEVLI